MRRNLIVTLFTFLGAVQTARAVCTPSSTVIPSSSQTFGVAITAPPNSSQVPIPPGTQLVTANCAIGSVPGQPINILYVVDVSGSTDLAYMTANGIPKVDTNGDSVINALDDVNGDGQAGEVLDGELAGVLALNTSIGNPANVRVGATAFASNSARADMQPGAGDQAYTSPPQADLSLNGSADVRDVLKSFRSSSSGGSVGQFTAKGTGVFGSNTDFPNALTVMNNTLALFPSGTNIVFFLSDGESNSGGRCFQSPYPCATQLAAAVAAGTKINTVAVGAAADPVDLQYIATATGGTFTQVTNPSLLATVLPSLTPQGIDHAEIDGVTVPLDGIGNFSSTVSCPAGSPPNPFTVTATCVATDGAATTVNTCITLSCNLLCGNGTVDTGVGEECEPPNTATCDAQCRRIPVCGDNILDTPQEQCDPPNGTTCDANCFDIVCGNGIVQVGEQCDPPNGTTCDVDCTTIACGNGVVQPGEECEPPNTPRCDSTCQRVSSCGDAFIDAPEECEPPSTGTCDSNCRLISCGNNIVQPGEECEPPNTTFCDATCQRVPLCGDGFVDGEETCDPPNGATCDTDCTVIECGNGDVEPGEECEPPNTITCDATCQRVPKCGDGNLDGSEQCEPPNSPNCDANCTLIACGNNVVQPGEECEPPNTATCDATCQRVPVCGDGFFDPPTEQCEPPNTATCSATCKFKEVCNDAIDNDGDGLIDCLDPDCPPCVVPKKDPAKIKFGKAGRKGQDIFQAHGSLTVLPIAQAFDPATDSVTVVLSNANEVIFRTVLSPGMLTQRSIGTYEFKDRSLAVADGLAKLKLAPRKNLWVFSVQAKGNFAAATEQQMTLDISVGQASFSLSRNWQPRPWGWYLSFDKVK